MEYFGKAGLNGQTAKLTTVKQIREIGSAVLTCEDLSNWATDTPVFFATYKVDIDTQKIIPNSQINWRGKVNVENNTIVEIQADSDTPDKGNAIGDIVECLPTAGWANSLVDGILKTLNQDGTIKDGVVKNKHLAEKAVKAQNVDFTTFPAPAEAIGPNSASGSNNVVLVSLSYNFIAGRRYLILASCARVDRAAAGVIETRLRVGTNVLNKFRTFGGSSFQMGVSMQRLYTPSSTSTESVDIFTTVLSGGTGFDYEYPVISIVPLPSAA